jgi:hypothetical protein
MLFDRLVPVRELERFLVLVRLLRELVPGERELLRERLRRLDRLLVPFMLPALSRLRLPWLVRVVARALFVPDMLDPLIWFSRSA